MTALERPPEHLIRAFRAGMAGADTIGDLLQAGHSLVICSKECPHIVEWTPPELERRFGTMTTLRVAELAPRLSCAGDEGCGAKEVAVFPRLFHGEWKRPLGPRNGEAS